MARAEIAPGNCGFGTVVETKMDGVKVSINIESECKAIQKLAAELSEVEPFREISFRGEGPKTLRLGAQHCTYAACPVPVGIIKAIEIEAGLALPTDAVIKLSK